MPAPKITKVNDTLTKVGEKVRIEAGPAKLVAVATVELLSNARTAQHYRVGANDANGRPIVLGQEMAYLAWGGEESEPQAAFYLYQLQPRPIFNTEGKPVIDPKTGAQETVADPNHWVEVESFATEGEAMTAALALA